MEAQKASEALSFKKNNPFMWKEGCIKGYFMNFFYENFKESLMKGLNDFKLVHFFFFPSKKFFFGFPGTKMGIHKTPKTE